MYNMEPTPLNTRLARINKGWTSCPQASFMLTRSFCDMPVYDSGISRIFALCPFNTRIERAMGKAAFLIKKRRDLITYGEVAWLLMKTYEQNGLTKEVVQLFDAYFWPFYINGDASVLDPRLIDFLRVPFTDICEFERELQIPKEVIRLQLKFLGTRFPKNEMDLQDIFFRITHKYFTEDLLQNNAPYDGFFSSFMTRKNVNRYLPVADRLISLLVVPVAYLGMCLSLEEDSGLPFY